MTLHDVHDARMMVCMTIRHAQRHARVMRVMQRIILAIVQFFCSELRKIGRAKILLQNITENREANSLGIFHRSEHCLDSLLQSKITSTLLISLMRAELPYSSTKPWFF